VTRRGTSLVTLLLLAVVVNLPLLDHAWTQWRLDRSGVDVTATVTSHRELGSGDQTSHRIWFLFPTKIDPGRSTRRAEVDESTYGEAVASGRIGVRVVEDDPSVFRADGATTSRVLLVATLVADAVLVGALLVWRRFRDRLRPRLRAVATEDVESCEPGSLLERLDEGLYLVRGEVAHVEDGRVVLEVGDRSVEVLLDGHHSSVGRRQPAQVRARLID
jgi:hypothetical protein